MGLNRAGDREGVLAEERRRLAAIVAADVAGYSRLMGADEEATIAALRDHRQQVIEPCLAQYHGRIANTAGDSFLIEFASAVDALRSAMDIQSQIAERNRDVPEDRRLILRIGINVGDVVSQGEDLLGDGVNVAARLEGLAAPGGIHISRSARDQVRDRLDVDLEDLGEIEVKNITRPVRAFRVAGLGAKPGAEAPGDPAGTGRSPWILAAAIVGVILVGGGGFWWWQQQAGMAETTAVGVKNPSIAVLPFVNLSDNKEEGYFADGISEDITTDLSKVAGLYVSSRSATLRFRNKSVDPKDIASALGVGHVLEGSVRRAGDKIRVTAKLIDARTGDQVWADRYDRDAQGIFAIQDDIAHRVVTQLSRTFTAESLTRVQRTYTPNIEAYDLYIQGRAKRIPPTPPNLAAALALFDKAIAVDPKFAGGYAGAAYVHVLRFDAIPVPFEAAKVELDTALRLAKKAVALDPAFGPGWGSLAEAYVRTRDFDKAFDAIQMAIKMAPTDSLMRASYGKFLSYVGKPDEGIKHVKQAMRMSPDSLPLLFFLAANHRVAGDYDKAIEALIEHRKRLGGRILPAPPSQLIASYMQRGKTDEGRAEMKKLLKVVPHFTAELAARNFSYKHPDEMKKFLEALRAAGLPQ
jgi:adenylate cyclase